MVDIIRGFLNGLALPCLVLLACIGVGLVIHILGRVLIKKFCRKELRSFLFLLCCIAATFYGGSKGIRQTGRRPQSNTTIQRSEIDSVHTNAQALAAFRVVDIALSNDTFTVETAWTNGLFATGTKLDYLVKTNLTDEAWMWSGCEIVTEGVTNSVHHVNLNDFASLVQGGDNLTYRILPSSLFVRVVPRLPVSDMTDSDHDGLPDAYEFHNNTNPWVADYEQAALRVVVDGRTNLQSVVDHCEPYAVVEIAQGTYSGSGWSNITLPPNPVLITGRGGVPVFRDNGFASFLLPSNTTEETMIRDIYLDRSEGGLQVGFWCGGNLPWINRSASATFENVYVRFSNPESSCYGWIFYGASTNRSVLSRCTINANGASRVRGVYTINPPPLKLDHDTFINFPASSTNNTSVALLLETLRGTGETNGNPIAIENTVFDASFTNAELIARLGPSNLAPITVQNSILPRAPAQSASIDASASLWITNATLSAWGYPTPGSPADIVGAGALVVLDPTSLQDSDGDGLTDWQETYQYKTSPILWDSDNDGISDRNEIEDGTSPNDASCYTYNLTLTITNDLPSTPELRYSVYTPNFSAEPTSTFALPATNIFVLSLDHLLVTNNFPSVINLWCDGNTNGICDAEEWSKSIPHETKPHDVTTTIQLSKFTDSGDGIPEFWWHLKKVTNVIDRVATKDLDHDGLINLHEYWAGTHPLQPDGSNTWLSIFSRSVDDRLEDIEPSVTQNRFINYFQNGTNSIFTTNTNFWLKGVDTSCVSIWNNGRDPGSMNAIAITRKHVILSEHWRAGSYVFCHTNGIVAYRSLTTNSFVSGDMRLAQLDKPLPDSFIPTKILSSDFSPHLASGKYLPSVCLNQEKAATVLEVGDLNTSTVDEYGRRVFQYGKIQNTNVVTTARARIRGASYDGNSSTPVFLLAGNDLVFLFAKHLGSKNKHTWATEWGPMIPFRTTEIQNKINTWEGTNSVLYKLNIFSLENQSSSP